MATNLLAPPKAIISWPGYGIMFFWQLGVLQYLQETYDLTQCAMVGSSAGALLSVLAACGVQPQAALDRAYELCVEHGVFKRPLGLLGVWGGIVRQWLQELLPADAAQRCSNGHVQLVLTTLPFLRGQVVSEFKDRDDLVAAALASAHLPFILDWRLAAAWRGKRCVDGSLMYILTRRCRFLKPPGSSSCPLLLFDPFACGTQLLSAGGLARCISLAGNSKAAVQQLMSQGVAHAQRMAAAGQFAALPLKAGALAVAAAAAAATERVPRGMQQQVDDAADLPDQVKLPPPMMQQQQQQRDGDKLQQLQDWVLQQVAGAGSGHTVGDMPGPRQRGNGKLDASSHAGVVDINAICRAAVAR
ncbi:hypothetical protein OEZ86_003765 [Tetradesmus obliquus]|nr:hypothetical protein OEZ86_003765 [Tetradesmus obliquus]